jgi:hypothetical protein
VPMRPFNANSPDELRVLVRRFYYLACDLLDHIESDNQFKPANRDDYQADLAEAKLLIRLVRDQGINR